jgi:hypothetical protein
MNTAPDRWASANALFSDPVIQAVLGLLVLSIVTMVAYFALSKLRALLAYLKKTMSIHRQTCDILLEVVVNLNRPGRPLSP